jgi:hypothetical protein
MCRNEDRASAGGVRVVILVRLDSCSADHGGQPSGLTAGETLQAFKGQVSALQLPLVVLLE